METDKSLSLLVDDEESIKIENTKQNYKSLKEIIYTDKMCILEHLNELKSNGHDQHANKIIVRKFIISCVLLICFFIFFGILISLA